MFHALLLNQINNKITATVEQITEDQLPNSNTVIKVEYSSLNYKDGLAITGKSKIVRNFPMVPGIDLVGKVVHCDDAQFSAGTNVILTGWGVGENHWGGMAQRARLDSKWLVPLPSNLTPKKAMVIGTAGFTAMLCVQAIIDANIKPCDGEILVTGASGGVGSVAVTLLAQLGYKVAALTGRAKQNTQLLTKLGASRIIDRSKFEGAARPLEQQIWAGAIDTVGSKVLAKVLAQMNYNSTVAACGLAGGFDLPTTVMPFILRNVRLQGIDSVMYPIEKRAAIWKQLAHLLPEEFFNDVCCEITLDEVPAYAEKITNGQVTGRIIIKL